jgi:class 3 adenylate cyclase
MATTQTVTVLFTDLVGSTELSSRLGPQATDELRQTHFGLLRGAIQTTLGTEVKNLGDGLMVAFTSLSRALACAVAMQQAIERHNRRVDTDALSVRIGLSTGEVTEQDGDYFGDPVIEAARLCALALGGQILATEMVKAMAGRHATQEFVSVGDLVLKGLPEPVPSVKVVWEPTEASESQDGQFPLPARLVSASAESVFAFFGRADELTHLTDAQKTSASENRLQVVLISGEPGIGKTALVAQAARAAHSWGANVLYGNCEEGLGIPYQPWISALSQLIDHADEELLREFVNSKGLSLAHLLPDLARRLSMPSPSAGSDADTERFLIFDGVGRLLALASTRAPLVVVLDDLHWVDAASLQLLRHLVISAIPMSVLVVGSFRESDLSRSHPLTGALADLRRESCVDRLDLLGLEDIEIIDLLEAAAGHEMTDEGVALAHALRRETDGNPFFLVEVIRHLADTGAFVQDDDGRWLLSTDLDALSLPTSVREVVAHRVARLGEDTEQVLSLASVIGRDFDADVLSGLLGKDENELLGLLEGAIAAGLISEAENHLGRYRFVHALIQHTLYLDLSANRRQLAHKRVAEALEAAHAEDNEHVAELARHWMAATRPSDVTKALHYARRAGDVALAAYAPLDAVSWYTQALELAARHSAPDDHQRCELLLRLGGAELQFDPVAGFETLRRAGDLAEKIGSTDLLIKWAHIRPPGWRTSEPPDPDRLRRLNQVLAIVDADDHALRARLLAAVAEETDPAEWRRRRQVADEAVAAAMEADDDATTVDVIMSTSFITLSPDRAREHVELAKKVLAISETRPDPVILAGLLHFMMTASLVVGDVEAARQAVDRLSALAEVYGSPLVLSLLHQTNVCLHMLEGDLGALERDAESMLALGLGAGMPTMVAAYGGALFEMRWAQGRLAEISDMAAAALDDLPSYSGFRAAVVVVYCATGQLDLARAVFAPEAAADFAEFPFDQIWLACMALFSEGAIALGDARAQATLYERLVPFADLHAAAGPIFYGSMQRPVGCLAAALGRRDQAEDHLRRALAEHRRIGASFWLARTAVELAEVLLGSPSSNPDGGRRRQEALSLLQEVRQLAVNRYGDVEARAEQLMDTPGMAGT